MDTQLNRLFSFLRENALIFYAGIGMGLYRCAHEWPLWFNAAVAHVGVGPLFEGGFFFLLVDMGKVAGLVAYLALCYGFDAHRRSGFLLALPSALIVAGCLVPLLVVLGIDPGPRVVVASLVLIGGGAGMLFAQWIEFCGYLPPVKVIQVFAVSFAVRFVVLPLVTGVDALSSTLLVMALAGTSFVQVAFCFDKVPSLGASPRVATGAGSLSGFGTLFLFVCVFAFAYGLCGSATSLSHSASETGWGTVLPSVVVLVLAFKMGDRFDRTILYAIALPLMTAGLIGVEFLGVSPSLSQVLVSAAYSTFDLLVYTLVCSSAYQNRTSAMLPGSCVRVFALVAADAAIVLMRLVPALNQRRRGDDHHLRRGGGGHRGVRPPVGRPSRLRVVPASGTHLGARAAWGRGDGEGPLAARDDGVPPACGRQDRNRDQRGAVHFERCRARPLQPHLRQVRRSFPQGLRCPPQEVGVTHPFGGA